MLETLPEWIGTALLGAVIAAVGFVGKLLYELWSDLRRAQATRLARIIDLSVLLTVSRVLFLVQNRWAEDLLQVLHRNHPDAIGDADGFEAIFARLHHDFSLEEAAVHNRIRNWTVHGLRPINEAILDWLEKDTLFRTTYINAKDDKKRELAEQLIGLHAHLLLWRCKYDAWIPADPNHALVYLADEAAHGIGFPTRLDDLIRDVMAELKKSAPALPVVKEQVQGGE